MIPELVNLSRGRPAPHPAARRPRQAQAAETALSPEETSADRLIFETLIAEGAAFEEEIVAPQLSAEEFALQAYAAYGADDRPDAAEAYALGDGAELIDANIDPPAAWSDTVFLAAAPSLRPMLARGFIGTAYAHAKATLQEEMGELPSPALRAGLEARGAPDWLVGQLAELSLHGAPVTLDADFASSLYWRASTAHLINDLAHALRANMPEHLTHIIVVPWLASGGAERVALWHARAVAEAGGRCLMLATDGRRESWVSRLPASAHYLCLNTVVDSIGLTGHLGADDCAMALTAALAQTPFKVLHVINSYVGTRMLRNPIDWAGRRIFYALYGVGRDEYGFDHGYWLSASELKGVDLFLSDNSAVPRLRAPMFGLDFERFRGIAYPVEASLKYSGVRRVGAGPRRVLWASRLDPEKQPLMVFEIAKQMPEVEFNMFGTGVLSDGKLPYPPPNVRLRGSFDGWESLPAEPFECFLFTSGGVGEGLPNIILEAMGAGLPIVASAVGAVPEVLGGGNGWLVAGVSEPDEYISALKEVFGNPMEANKRARAALLEVTRNRTFAKLQAELEEIGYL